MTYADPNAALYAAADALARGVGPFPRVHIAGATTAVANRFVASANMKLGAYTLANGGLMPNAGARRITVTHTTVSGADTLGTIDVVGLDLAGNVISESIVPLAATLHSVVVNTAAAGAITLSDADGTIAVLKASVSEGTYVYGAACSGFIGVDAAAATDVTVLYAT